MGAEMLSNRWTEHPCYSRRLSLHSQNWTAPSTSWSLGQFFVEFGALQVSTVPTVCMVYLESVVTGIDENLTQHGSGQTTVPSCWFSSVVWHSRLVRTASWSQAMASPRVSTVATALVRSVQPLIFLGQLGLSPGALVATTGHAPVAWRPWRPWEAIASHESL